VKPARPSLKKFFASFFKKEALPSLSYPELPFGMGIFLVGIRIAVLCENPLD
jgi:hypothetical protein